MMEAVRCLRSDGSLVLNTCLTLEWLSVRRRAMSRAKRRSTHCAGMFSGAGLVNSAIDPEGRFFIDRDPKVCLHNPPRAFF